MKKYIIPSISVIFLSLFLFMGISDFSTLAFQFPQDKLDYINGQFIEVSRKNFDQKIPIDDFAISFWSKLKFTIFREGSKGVLTGNDNWLFTSEEYEENLQNNLTRADYFEKISQVHNYFQQRDISLVLVLVPSKSRIYSDKISAFPQSEKLLMRYSETVEELQRSGLTVVELEKAFMKNKEKEKLFYKYDTHWTYEGAFLSAGEIQKQITPLLLQKNVQRRDFSMEIREEKFFEGDLLAFVPALKVEWESFKETEIIDNNPPVLGMFDSIEIPLILVGTSYSADSRWNFEKILKNTLKLDVLNLADEGKGPLPSMDDLMKSEYYKEINSRIIIWEIPERYIPLG